MPAFPRRTAWLVFWLSSWAAACSSAPEPTDAADRTVRDLPAIEDPGALALPNRTTSVKFAVIGDSGRGWKPQHDVAGRMAEYRERFRFDFVLMAGDNIYEGPAGPEDYRAKFEEPYRALLDDGVRFFAVLGNHDDPAQRFYPLFNMKGERYYTFRAPSGLLARLTGDVQVFAFDSTNIDEAQLEWAARELSRSDARWKIALLHHPLYTAGRYGAHAWRMRRRLEPVLVAGGIDVAFSGHEHIYARMKPQRGVQYVISGGAGSLREGDARPGPAVARAFDADFHFVLVEIDGDELYLQAITRSGRTIDAAVIEKTAALTALGRAVPR